MSNSTVASHERPLTPRKDRLEAEMVSVLRRGGTRSSLKVVVEEFADYARLQGTPADQALSIVTAIAHSAGPEMAARGAAAVGDSAPDRITMMVRWFKSRYHRND